MQGQFGTKRRMNEDRETSDSTGSGSRPTAGPDRDLYNDKSDDNADRVNNGWVRGRWYSCCHDQHK